MSKLLDKTSSRERQAYLDAHKKEYPFPLDGSDWAREIREHQFFERHPNCRCQSCQNLLTRLRDKDSFLKRQHNVIQRALHHWFLHDAKLAYWMNDQLTAEELAKLTVKLEANAPQEESLDETEARWLSKKTFSRPDNGNHEEYDLASQILKLHNGKVATKPGKKKADKARLYYTTEDEPIVAPEPDDEEVIEEFSPEETVYWDI